MLRGALEGAGGRPLLRGPRPHSERECHAGRTCFCDPRAHWGLGGLARAGQSGGGLGRLIYNLKQCLGHARGPCSGREQGFPGPQDCGGGPLSKKKASSGDIILLAWARRQQHSWAMQELLWKPRYLPGHTVCDNDLWRSLQGKKSLFLFAKHFCHR